MRSKTKFELVRWVHLVILFLLTGLVGILLIGLFLVVPSLNWLFHDIPYVLPTLNRVGRVAVSIFFISVFSGTVAWYYEKRQSGR